MSPEANYTSLKVRSRNFPNHTLNELWVQVGFSAKERRFLLAPILATKIVDIGVKLFHE